MKTNANKRNRLAVLILLPVYFLLISLVLIRAFNKPEYNWDMLAYMGVVISADRSDIAEIHRDTYQAARDHIPAFFFQQLINPSNTYRAAMYRSDTAFYRQLAFYVVKPLYTGLISAAARAGLPLPAATVLPSLISYLGISILLLIWFAHYLPLLYASGSALLIMLSAPLLIVSGLSTPDALSAFLLLGAFYFTIEKPVLPLMIILMTAAVLVRLDNILVCLLTICFMAFSKQPPFRIRPLGYAGLLLGLAAVYCFVSARARPFGFHFLFYPSFIRYMNLPHQYDPAFSLSGYLDVFRTVAITGLYHSALALFGFLAVLLFFRNYRGSWRLMSFYARLPVLCCLVIVLRFVLDPDISDRFYIPYYLLIAVMWVRSLSWDPVYQISKT